MPRPVNALIVDDEPHVVLLLRNLLGQLSVETVWDASDGQEALEIAAEKKPAVVLLDINLPGMDGMHVLERLRSVQPETPVIMISAQTTLRSISRAHELGAVGYVVKYAPNADVLKCISDLFDRIAAGTTSGDRAADPAPPVEPTS